MSKLVRAREDHRVLGELVSKTKAFVVVKSKDGREEVYRMEHVHVEDLISDADYATFKSVVAYLIAYGKEKHFTTSNTVSIETNGTKVSFWSKGDGTDDKYITTIATEINRAT